MASLATCTNELPGSRQHPQTGAVLHQELGKELCIQTIRGFPAHPRRKLRCNAQIQRRITQRQVQIDQKRLLLRRFGQRHREVAGQRGARRRPWKP